MRQVASGVSTAARSCSGLRGARLVGKQGPWTTASTRRQVDPWVVRCEDRDHLLGRPRAGHGREVVGAIHRRPVVDVVGSRHQHRADTGLRKPGELGGHALHRALGLDVRVEQVAGDEEQVHLLGDREVDGGAERGKLPLALGRRGLPEIRVTRAEVDVCDVQQSKHRVRLPSLVVRPVIGPEVGKPNRVPQAAAPAPRSRDLARSRAARAGPVAPGTRHAFRAPPSLPARIPSLAAHCDISGVTPDEVFSHRRIGAIRRTPGSRAPSQARFDVPV